MQYVILFWWMCLLFLSFSSLSASPFSCSSALFSSTVPPQNKSRVPGVHSGSMATTCQWALKNSNVFLDCECSAVSFPLSRLVLQWETQRLDKYEAGREEVQLGFLSRWAALKHICPGLHPAWCWGWRSVEGITTEDAATVGWLGGWMDRERHRGPLTR